jgi:hypothetical protein
MSSCGRLKRQSLRAPGFPLSIVKDETNLEAGSERTDDRLLEVLAVDRIPRFCEVLDLGLNHDEGKTCTLFTSCPPVIDTYLLSLSNNTTSSCNS